MKFWFVLLIFFIFAGCEKTIQLQPEAQKPVLVVDGSIESGQAPYIVLSTSLNYFSTINPQVLVASIVRDATLTLSDSSRTVPLKAYSVLLAGIYSYVYYSADTTTSQLNMKGAFGKTYTLQINYNNNTYTSVTHIPLPAKTLDSIWWKPAPHNTDTSKVVLMGKLSDPEGYGNYIRYFTKVNSGSFLPGATSAFDDQVTDGSVYNAQIDQGIDRNNKPVQDEYGYFKRGDSVTVKLTNIDKATFNFWRTLEFSYQSIGNPFSSPVKVLSNVSNGALGAFCGYAVQYKSLIIPK